MIEKIVDFLKRNGVLLIFVLATLYLSNLESPEIRAFLLASLLECIAIAFSGFAVFVFTNVRFTENPVTPNLGLIFLGVHISFGLSVLALYLAQFTN
jgi:hypothetical protein